MIVNARARALPADTNVTYIIAAEDSVGKTITTEELGYKLEHPIIPELPCLHILSILMIITLVLAIFLKNQSSCKLSKLIPDSRMPARKRR